MVKNSPNIGTGDVPSQMKDTESNSQISQITTSQITTQSQPQYLIETNTSFINQNDFIGSEYFLSRMGYDIDNYVLLGDPFYETRFVTDRITQTLNDKYTNNGNQKTFQPK